MKITDKMRRSDDDYTAEQHKELDDKAKQWRMKKVSKTASLPAGRRLLLPKKQVTHIYNQYCPSCNNSLSLVSSTLGIMTFGFSSKWKELPPEYTIVDGELCTVNIMVRRSMPISKRVRVCPQCVDKLDKVIFEGDSSQNLMTGKQSGLTYQGRITNKDFEIIRPGRRRLVDL